MRKHCSVDDVIKSLENDSNNLFKWFLDSNKCHLITSKQSCRNLKIRNINNENSTCEKLLRVKIDNKLNFNKHQDRIIEKVSRKVNRLI